MSMFTGENLTSIRNGRIVFEDLSFSVTSGEILALTGPNGTGKTSLLRIMGGLLDYAGGGMSWDGAALKNAPPCHWLGSENPLKPKLSVWDNLSFWYECYTVFDDQKAAHNKEQAIIDSLEKMAIAPLKDTPVRYLSTGQRRRANLARLFLQYRPLWLLDEPATGLDAETKDALFLCLQGHKNEGGISVIATHRPEMWQADQMLDMGALQGAREAA